MDWTWAFEQMKAGQRVRHGGMDGTECWCIGWKGRERAFFANDIGMLVEITPDDLERTDWQIADGRSVTLVSSLYGFLDVSVGQRQRG